MIKQFFYLFLFLSIITISQAQDRFPLNSCDCQGTPTTWTSTDGKYKITYKDCMDGTVEMVSFEYNNTSAPNGWITAMEGFNAFFDAVGVPGLKMPASCLKWKQIGKELHPHSETGYVFFYGIFLCDDLNGDAVNCCVLSETQARDAIQFLHQSPDRQCENATVNQSGQRCFKLCGYID